MARTRVITPPADLMMVRTEGFLGELKHSSSIGLRLIDDQEPAAYVIFCRHRKFEVPAFARAHKQMGSGIRYGGADATPYLSKKCRKKKLR